ncbi:MAG: cation transporter [Candidatus Omnitrophica bacterium]|nr:cation transporter [Candidatus Omnitrophota bacterium]
MNIYEKNSREYYSLIKRAAGVSILTNICLAAVKFTLGFVGRSQAVIADAVHSLSDLGTDFAVLFGVDQWAKPPDEEHPYGHGRIETIVTLIITLILILIALGIGYNALASIGQKDLQQPEKIALVAALISIVAKEILYRYTIKIGKKTKSSALIANAWHQRSDVLSSVPVAIVVGIAAVNPRWAYLDNVGAVIVSLLIIYIAVNMMKQALTEIVDTGASKNHVESINKIVLATEGVKETHALRSRRIGGEWYLDLHIHVEPRLSVLEGHNISENVKRNLIENGPDVVDVVIHLEPYGDAGV